MRRRLVFWSVIIACAVLGAVAAALLATRRADSAAVTRQFLLASMVNPPNTLESPRTYNQTLVESVDTDQLIAALNDDGYPVVGLRFDVLPDSYHIQVASSLTTALSDALAARLGQALAAKVSLQSAGLAATLFEATPAPAVRVTLTKALPESEAVTQNPTVTGLFGALAGALVGLFIALSLPVKTSRRTAS